MSSATEEVLATVVDASAEASSNNLLFQIVFLVGVLAVTYYLFFAPPASPSSNQPFSNNFGASAKRSDKGDNTVQNAALKMKILYGSQSGTAESFAYQLQKEAKAYSVAAEVIDIENYTPEDITEETNPVIFLVATYGEGDPTDSAIEFQKYIMDASRTGEPFDGLNFSVFALGNKQYEHFCAVGKRWDARFGELGAQRLLELGIGDDDGSIEDDYAQWRKQFWDVLASKYKLEAALGPKTFSITFKSNFSQNKIEEEDGSAAAASSVISQVDLKKRIQAFDSKYPVFDVPVLSIRELRQDRASGSTVHVELDMSAARCPYITADNLGVHPRNDFRLAGRIAKRLGLHPSATFTLEKVDKESRRKAAVPSPCTVRDALLWHFDIAGAPTLGLLEVLANFASDIDEKEKLLRLTKSDGKAEYQEFIINSRKNLMDVLEAFPSVQLPWDVFLEYVPRLKPRYYTIASSSKVHPQHIHVVLSVVQEKLADGRTLMGVASNFLASLRPGKDTVPVHIRPSTFRLPRNSDTPIIMVGPGTGVAPFRGFMQELTHLRRIGSKVGDALLFFGCRHSEQDWIYHDEMQTAANDGVVQLVLAFSRQNPDRKVYVQHRLSEHADQIWQLLSQRNAYFYVCGATSMGRDVRDAISSIFVQQGGKSAEEAQKLLKQLQGSGRYIQELWES